MTPEDTRRLFDSLIKIPDLVSAAPRTFRSIPLLGIVLFIFSTAFPPLDLLTQANLAIHMGQHALIALSGVLIAYPICLQRKELGRTPRKNYAITSIILISAIVLFWHLPAAWDAAVLSPVIHGIEHFSFLGVGLLIGWYFPALPDNFKFMSVFLGASGHMVYGLYLFVMTTPVYPLYPVGQQTLLAILMLFPSPVLFIPSLVISLNRETNRLEAMDLAARKQSGHNANPIRSKRRFSFGQIAVPVATLLLIAVFAGYLAVTGGMIYSSSISDPSATNAVSVYVLETPVTWQYSPQNIVVVIGVNNTVVWVSHSFSEDTVTSNSGIFSSGVLHPARVGPTHSQSLGFTPTSANSTPG